MAKELREMSYDKLVEYSKEVFREVRRRAYAEGFEAGRSHSFEREYARAYGEVKSPQQLRDEIVQRAKADVRSLIELKPRVKVGDLNGNDRVVLTDNYSVKFNVNKEKRTVAAILRGNVSQRVRAKGIAKCSPSDCFNVNIGKAIALRRAIGLDVPDEYLNAPQPTEVRVGDVAKGKKSGVIIDVEEVEGKLIFGKYRNGDGCRTAHYDIIDDSRE